MHWYDIPELLPPVYRGIKSMWAVADSENTELKESLCLTDKVLQNFFIETCDATTIAYWEALLNINAEPGQTLDERRAIVMATVNSRKPITMLSVREMMDNIFGAGNYVFKIDENNPLKVVIGLEGASYSQQTSFLTWFYKVCPAHLLIQLTNQQTVMNKNWISGNGAPIAIARASFTIPQASGIDIDCNWGDAVTIPAGYTVQSVKTTTAFAKISNKSRTPASATNFQMEISGANELLPSATSSDFTLGTDPCLQIFVYNSTNFDYGYYYTFNSKQTSLTTKATNIDVLKLNEDGLFFKIDITFSNSTTTTTVYNAITNGRSSSQMRYYDSSGSLVKYAFNAPPSSWSFDGDTFTWASAGVTWSQIWFYLNKTPATRIHCVPSSEPANYIEILCGLRWRNNAWSSETFSANDYWYSAIMNATDRQRVLDFMNSTLGNISSGYVGQYGAVASLPTNYIYTPLALYSDEAGTQLVTSDMSNFKCGYLNIGQQEPFPVTIESINAFSTPCMTWKLRITKQ